MRVITTLLRLFVGILFIISGLIKSNDPTGFSYKLDEYFTVFADDLSPEADSLTVSISDLDGETTKSVAIPNEINSLNFNYKNSEWIRVDIDEETTIYISTGSVDFAGQRLLDLELNASDTGELLYKGSIAIKHGQESIYNGEIVMTGLQIAAHSADIDITSFQQETPWYVSFLKGLRDYALLFAIGICLIEILLGLALLIGFAPKLTLWSLLGMLIFFGFLTWYSAFFNKVTDCGCFGDAIKFTPWQSFFKDLILLFATLIIFIGKKHLTAVFSKPASVKFLTVCTLIAGGYSLYCWHYLPVKNFLKFKEGTDIRKEMEVPEGGRESDHIIREYLYENNGESIVVKWDSDDNSFTPNINPEWKYVGLGKETILEERTEPNIHDFKIMDETLSNDYTEDFFTNGRWKLLIVMNDLEKTRISSIEQIKAIIEDWRKQGNEVYILTASEASEVQEFRHMHQISEPFYYGDKTNLKSIIRSNPGLLLIDSSTVVGTWPSTRLPDTEKLSELTK